MKGILKLCYCSYLQTNKLNEDQIRNNSAQTILDSKYQLV